VGNTRSGSKQAEQLRTEACWLTPGRLSVALAAAAAGIQTSQPHHHVMWCAGAIHQLWCCLISFVVVLAIVEITKPFSGRLRPDFLARCQPAGLNTGGNSTGPYNSALGGNLGQAILGPVHLGQVAGDCTNPNHDTVKDGRLRCAQQRQHCLRQCLHREAVARLCS
jgi:hypothetical protein